MLTSVIIPCWNALDLTQVCLRHLESATTAPYEIIVVDDASSDGTWNWLRGWARRRAGGRLRRVALRRASTHRGYSTTMNRGLAAARGGFIVYGNSDALPTPGWLEAMHEAWKSRPKIGGLAPRSNPPRTPLRGEPSWSAPPYYRDVAGLARFSAAMSLRPAPRPFLPCDHFIPGFWFFTSRRLLDRVGPFDETFNRGSLEDWDLQARILRAGYRLGYAPRAFVHHEWSGVGRRNGVEPGKLMKINAARFKRKHPWVKNPRMLNLNP